MTDNSPARDPYDLPPPWWQQRADWVWTIVVGALTAILTVITFPAFPPYAGVPEFAYAFAVPAVYWAYHRPSFRRFALTLLVAQAVAWTTLLWWVHPVTWVGLFLLGPIVGAWVGVWYLAVWWAAPRLSGRPASIRLLGMLGLAAAWVLVEWTRTWLLGGFPWLPLAASQWQRTSLLQVAAYTGAYGVSFVLIAVNLGFAAVAHSLFHDRQTGWRLRRPEFLLALFLLMLCVSVQVQEEFNAARYRRKLADVAIVQPDIPQTVKWDQAKAPEIYATLAQATMVAAAAQPDFIVWPESTTPLAVRGDPGARAWIESLDARAGRPMLFGSDAIEDAGTPRERWHNAMFVVTPDLGLQTAYYAKRHLVPFGEYIPWRPVLGWLDKFVPIGGDFTPGRSDLPLQVPLRHESLAAGPLICYEDIFPALARADVRAGADFLFVATNNAWYGEGAAAYQHAAHSVLRAVETRRPVLRCGNAGWSGWIDEFGVIREVVVNDRDSVYCRKVATFPIQHDTRWAGRESFYVAHGDWFVAACAILALLGWLALKIGPTQRTPSPGTEVNA